MTARFGHVRYAPKSGQARRRSACPLLPQTDISVFVAASNFQVAAVIAIIGGVAYMLEQNLSAIIL